MIKKAIAAAFVSAGLLVTVAPGAGAAAPQACNQGTERAHHTVPDSAHQAHMSIPHC
jgi:hypothetical protein